MNRDEMAREIWHQMNKEIELKQIKKVLVSLFLNIDELLAQDKELGVKNFGVFYRNALNQKRIRKGRK